MTTEMKPCPFCRSNETRCAVTPGTSYGTCESCGADGPLAKTASKAADMWNASHNPTVDREDPSEPAPAAVPVEHPTLHDRYVMAALTGWMANPVSGELTVRELVADARLAADAAMKARTP